MREGCIILCVLLDFVHPSRKMHVTIISKWIPRSLKCCLMLSQGRPEQLRQLPLLLSQATQLFWESCAKSFKNNLKKHLKLFKLDQTMSKNQSKMHQKSLIIGSGGPRGANLRNKSILYRFQEPLLIHLGSNLEVKINQNMTLFLT